MARLMLYLMVAVSTQLEHGVAQSRGMRWVGEKGYLLQVLDLFVVWADNPSDNFYVAIFEI